MGIKLEWEKFAPLMGTWADKIEPLFPLLSPVYEELKEQGRRGKKIFPAWQNVFKAFEKTDINNLKAVVCGICPYHSMTKDKTIVADGLAMSCSNTMELQPSLEQWYSALQAEYPNEEIIKNPDLTYLAKEGVLLFNMALTVENLKALSHNELWQPFIKAVFEEIIGPTGVPVILLGKEAHIARKWCAPFQWVFPISHPASAAYSQTEWSSEGTLKKVEKIVRENNNYKLKWMTYEK